ncbi:putative UDP-arabinopyranose mutase [Helianthus annuus]|nr:putative UDP-arabinopyranose mutase [Helianthus annuus]
MSQVTIDRNEVDIVIAAFRSDLTSFLEEWRPIFSRFHLIIVQDPDLKDELKIPKGFDFDAYTKTDIDKLVSPSNASMFSGYACRYFGYLISKRKYIVSIDDDCSPAKDNNGDVVDIVTQHITNLKTPATPLFFNTLYDPYRKLGVKTGIPYVWRNERGSAIDSLKKEWEGVKLMEELIPFFQTLKLSQDAVTAEACVLEMAVAIKKGMGSSHPELANAAGNMVEWVKIWKEVKSRVLV